MSSIDRMFSKSPQISNYKKNLKNPVAILECREFQRKILQFF